MTHRIAALSVAVLLGPFVAGAQETTESSLHWDELSWTEIGEAIEAGKTTAIVPTGAIEDKGPHMAVSQHSITVRHAAGEIARRLGSALVAPLITYAPNGDIAPVPTGHMRMMGSLTMPTEVYAALVEWVARSLRFHGMRDIAFIWDSGSNAAGIRIAAEKLNREWAGSGARVHLVSDYYTSTAAYEEWLKTQGESDQAIGQQAGITQTSEVMAIDRRLLRPQKFAMGGPREMEGSGVTGDPRRATAAYGLKSIEMKVDAAVKQLRALMAAR